MHLIAWRADGAERNSETIFRFTPCRRIFPSLPKKAIVVTCDHKKTINISGYILYKLINIQDIPKTLFLLQHRKKTVKRKSKS